MIDARRMEVYAAIYDRALNVKREISADIVDENSYLEYLEQHPVYFFGNGAAKCREKITHPNAHFIDDLHPLAKMMFPLAEKAVAINDYKDVAYFEPFYLKEFWRLRNPRSYFNAFHSLFDLLFLKYNLTTCSIILNRKECRCRNMVAVSRIWLTLR